MEARSLFGRLFKLADEAILLLVSACAGEKNKEGFRRFAVARLKHVFLALRNVQRCNIDMVQMNPRFDVRPFDYR